jgi:hypothetical protein
MTTHVLFSRPHKINIKTTKDAKACSRTYETKENDDLKISNDIIGVASMLGSRISGFDASESKNNRATGLAFQ